MKIGDSWIISNLESTLEAWNLRLNEIWLLLTESPETFKGGGIWNTITNINGALQAIGYGLLVLFFVVGMVKTAGSFSELKRPEMAFKLFIRFVLAKAVITHGMELMMKLLEIIQGVVTTIMVRSGLNGLNGSYLPDEMKEVINNVGYLEAVPLWIITLLGSLFILIISFIMIMTVYGRFFKFYMYVAISPVPLSTFGGEPTQNIGKSFLKSYAAVCLEAAVIALACIIFSKFASAPPALGDLESMPAVTLVWTYIGELVFNFIVLVGTVKMADRIVKEMMGL